MTFYLSSPMNRVQWNAVRGMPVLMSYALVGTRKLAELSKDQAVASRVMIDSGAYSEMTTGVKVDVGAFAAWAEKWRNRADAVACLDDISGDWKRGIANAKKMPKGMGFPTFHDTDPPEILDELVGIARERGGWIGLGLKPPREGKEDWVRAACDRIPNDLHVHGWALGRYSNVRRLDSVDSTNWLLDIQQYMKSPLTRHLTAVECMEIIIKRYERWSRAVPSPDITGQDGPCPGRRWVPKPGPSLKDFLRRKES